MAVSGNFAFVAEGYWENLVVDVSTPAAPTARGILDTYGNAVAVAVAAGLAYVAVDIEGLVVFEFSDPDAPTRARLLPDRRSLQLGGGRRQRRVRRDLAARSSGA